MYTKIKILFILICALSLEVHSQVIEISGPLNENTTWDIDTVKIIGDLLIEENINLKVSAGTYIELQGYYRIEVQGFIKALGNISDSIVFTINDTTDFHNDTLLTGGWAGIYFGNSTPTTDSSIFEYCSFQFAKNADEYGGDLNGGAIYAKDYNTIIITNSLFKNNKVFSLEDNRTGCYGGAVYCENVKNILIENCWFEQNSSSYFGGAIHIDKDCSHVLISDNYFKNNTAFHVYFGFAGGGGAAISASDAINFSPEIRNNYCFKNISVNGIIYTSNRNALIYNNVIYNNKGSGIMDGHELSSSRIFNNTIANNLYSGGVIELYSKAKVYNNICWGNENINDENNDIHITILNTSVPELFYNCVQYGNGGDSAIYENPIFVNPSLGVGQEFYDENADWSLLDLSPCINRGTPDTTDLFIPLNDILGNPRIYDKSIDMGAIENQDDTSNIIIQNNTRNNFRLYPNPGSDYFILDNFNFSSNFYIKIYDIYGKEILYRKLSSANNFINTTELSNGLYFYQIMKNNTIERSGKWIKK